MSRTFNSAILFERWKSDPKLVAYKSETAMLDAVQTGKKALLYTGFPISSIADGGEGFIWLLQAAFARGLAVTLFHRANGLPPERIEPNIYVLPLDQTWRISAVNALWETALVDGPWTDAAERQLSLLLGYTPKQRASWTAAFKHRQAAYGCLTMYTLLSAAQRETVEAVGKRCFGPASALAGMTFFFHRTREVLKKTAAKLVPKGQTLARVGFAWKASDELFGPPKQLKGRGLVKAAISKQFARTATQSLRSNVQFLTSAGWT